MNPPEWYDFEGMMHVERKDEDMKKFEKELGLNIAILITLFGLALIVIMVFSK